MLVDCADPSRFVILWDEAVNATGAPSSFQYGPGADVFIGSEGQPSSAALPPGMAARVEQALDRALGQAGLQGPGHQRGHQPR